jgi:hypothetical protein
MQRVGGFFAVLGMAVALVGCGGTTNPGAGAADLVPASAPLFVAMDTDLGSSQWHAVDQLANKFPDKQKAIDAAKKEMLKQGVDWDKDVKPALGPETDLVLLDFDHPNDVVVLMQPKDEQAFERTLKKGNAVDPANFVFHESFRGWMVMADKQAAIDAFKQASDSAKSTLAEDKTFSTAMDKAGEGLVRAYVNGAKVMAAARKFGGPQVAPYIDKLGTLDWITATVRAKSDGIAYDTTVHGTPGKIFKNGKGPVSDGSLQRVVPKDALLYFAFHGAKGQLASLKDNPVLSQPGFKQFGDVFQGLGSILQGENALYVRAPAGHDLPEVTFVAAPGRGVDGVAVLDRVLGRFSKEIGGRPRHTTVAGAPARILRSTPWFSLLYANVGGKLVVSNFPSAIRFTKSGGASLSESQSFNDTAKGAGMPDRPSAVLYVDIHSTIPAVERIGQMSIPPDVKRNLKPLQSAVEYAVSRSHEIQVSFFLRIQ